MKMKRRNPHQHVVADLMAMRMDVYRKQLQDISDYPCADWMDNACRAYSLRNLMHFTIENDRAHRKARGWH